MLDLEALPAEVKMFIEEQLREIQAKEYQIKERDSQIEILQEALRLARRLRFASHSEKLPSNQSELFVEAEVLFAKLAEEKSDSEDASLGSVIEVPGHTRARPKRQALPEHLPREDVVIDLLPEEKICGKDGTTLKEIGAEVSEQLDYVPAKLKVIRTIRKKYACPCCEDVVKTAALPDKILPKSNAMPGLLAYIATSKYVDALPLYRLEQIFKRDGVDIPRNTMAGWMIALSDKLQPLYNMMEEDLLNSDYVCCDETKVQVLKEVGKSPQSLSYMWVRARHGPGVDPIVLFDYDPTRSKEVPKRLLQGFKGYLQADGYAGYDAVCKNDGVVRVGCMAHVRREFFDVHKDENLKKKSVPVLPILELIQKLYKIEDQIKEKPVEDRFKVRQEQSKPILQEMKTWIDERGEKDHPKSLLSQALTYARNQWAHVIRYIENGKLSIDNNFTENRIRPFAIGRKNWLFSDSVAGAEASAMIYSILQTARGNGLEPYAYMRHLLTELPKLQTAAEIEKLLPHKIDFKILK